MDQTRRPRSHSTVVAGNSDDGYGYNMTMRMLAVPTPSIRLTTLLPTSMADALLSILGFGHVGNKVRRVNCLGFQGIPVLKRYKR